MITIRQAFDNFYVSNRPGLSRRTKARYSFEILRWERLTGNPPLNSITTTTFNQFRHRCLQGGLRPSTIESGLRTILQVLRLCGPEQERRQGLGLIPKVPYVGNPLRVVTPFQPTPTVEELRLAWQHAEAAIWPKAASFTPAMFWRAWLAVEFSTALRLSDMLTVHRSQLNGALLAVTVQKTGLTQVFPLPAWALLSVYQLPTGREKLLPCRNLPAFVRRELRRISQAAGIPKITPHGIRRASISEWSAINSDSGAIIHGSGLGIRSRYVDPLRLLRTHVASLPDLSKSA